MQRPIANRPNGLAPSSSVHLLALALVGFLSQGCGGSAKGTAASSSGPVRGAATYVAADAPVVVYGGSVRAAVEVARAAVLPPLAVAVMAPAELHKEMQRRYGFDPLSLEDLTGLGVEVDRDFVIEAAAGGVTLIVAVRDPARTLELMKLGGPAEERKEAEQPYFTRDLGRTQLSWATIGGHLFVNVAARASGAFVARALAMPADGPSWDGVGRPETLAVLAAAGSGQSPVVGAVNLPSVLWAELAPCMTQALGGAPTVRFGVGQDAGTVTATVAARLDRALYASMNERRRTISWAGMAELFAQAPIAVFVSVLGDKLAIPGGCRGVADLILPFAPAVDSVTAAVFEVDMDRGKGRAAVLAHAPSMQFATDLVASLGIPDFLIRGTEINGKKARAIRVPGVPEVVFHIGSADAVVTVGDGIAARAFATTGPAEVATRGLLDLRLAVDPNSPTAKFAAEMVRDALGQAFADLLSALNQAFARVDIVADVHAGDDRGPVGAAQISVVAR